MRKQHKWSKEEQEYLAEVVTGRYLKEVTAEMNKKFEYQFTEMQVGAAIKRYGLKMGVSTKWQKGHVPYNKGTKGVSKGNIPINAAPIGTERMHQGYTRVKVSKNKWELKQRVVYEKYHNVKLKPHDVVIFLNGNKKDFSKENLYLIDRTTQMYMAKHDLWSGDPELNKTAVKIAEIYKMAYKKRGEYMQELIERIEELKQENLRLKNENRVLKKTLEKRDQTIKYLRFGLTEREDKMQELESCYKAIKGKLYE